MSERAKPLVLDLENVPRGAATRPSPEPEAATEPSGQPGRVKFGEREFTVRVLTVTAKKVDHRVLRRYPAPPRRAVSVDVARRTPIRIPITLHAPIPVTPRALIRLTPPTPIPIGPRLRLVAAEPEPGYRAGVAD